MTAVLRNVRRVCSVMPGLLEAGEFPSRSARRGQADSAVTTRGCPRAYTERRVSGSPAPSRVREARRRREGKRRPFARSGRTPGVGARPAHDVGPGRSVEEEPPREPRVGVAGAESSPGLLLLLLRQDAFQLLRLLRLALEGRLRFLELGLGVLDLGRELALALGGLPGLLELDLGRGHVLLSLRRLGSPGHVTNSQPDDGGDDSDHDRLRGTSRSRGCIAVYFLPLAICPCICSRFAFSLARSSVTCLSWASICVSFSDSSFSRDAAFCASARRAFT